MQYILMVLTLNREGIMPKKRRARYFCAISTINSNNRKSDQGWGQNRSGLFACKPSSVPCLLVPEKSQKEQLKI